MAVPVTAIHVAPHGRRAETTNRRSPHEDVDGRDKPGHDEGRRSDQLSWIYPNDTRVPFGASHMSTPSLNKFAHALAISTMAFLTLGDPFATQEILP